MHKVLQFLALLMVYVGTKLRIVDNSGVKLVRCLKVLGTTQLGVARVGDILICSVQSAIPDKTLKRHSICKCIVVRICKPVHRKNGITVSFTKSVGVLIDQRRQPIGNRIKGCVMQELRIRRHLKIISIATTLI